MNKIASLEDVLLVLGLAETCSETERALVQVALTMANGAVRRYLQYDPTLGTRTEFYPQTDFSSQGRNAIWEASDTQAYMRNTSGTATHELQLQHLPIRSITSLYIDYDGRSGTRVGSFGAETLKTEGSDYWPHYDMLDSTGNKVCRDGILRSQGLWPDIAGSVKVVYVAGYSDAELRGQDGVLDASPLMEATVDEAVRRMLKIKSRGKNRLAGFVGPLTSETLGDYSYSAASDIWSRLVGGGNDLLPETEAKLSTFVRMDMGVL